MHRSGQKHTATGKTMLAELFTDPNPTISSIVLRWDFLILIVIGFLAGVARSALDRNKDAAVVISRVFLGMFFAASVVIFTGFATDIDVPIYILVLVLLVGSIYADDFITLIRERLLSKLEKKED